MNDMRIFQLSNLFSRCWWVCTYLHFFFALFTEMRSAVNENQKYIYFSCSISFTEIIFATEYTWIHRTIHFNFINQIIFKTNNGRTWAFKVRLLVFSHLCVCVYFLFVAVCHNNYFFLLICFQIKSGLVFLFKIVSHFVVLGIFYSLPRWTV